MGATIKGSVAKKVKEAISILASDTRPLIIDEADFLVKKSMIDIVREIADRTWIPVILIGEENLPHKLAAFERSHNRVLEFQAAEPCDMDDARQLAKLYVPQLTIEDALLKHVVEDSDGIARRICVNLERLNEFAKRQGVSQLTKELWGEQVLFRGRPEPRRKAIGRAA